MKYKNALCGLIIAVVLHLSVLAGSAQTNKWYVLALLTSVSPMAV